MLHRNLLTTTSRKRGAGQIMFMSHGVPTSEFPVLGVSPDPELYPELYSAFEEAKKVITEEGNWEKAREILAETGFRTVYHEVEFKDASQNAKALRSFTIETSLIKNDTKLVVTTTKPTPKVKEREELQVVANSVTTFRHILLHSLRSGGWEIIGVKHNRAQEVIANLTAITGQEQAERLAHQLSRSLAGKPYAEID